jgi:hypothetical protein
MLDESDWPGIYDYDRQFGFREAGIPLLPSEIIATINPGPFTNCDPIFANIRHQHYTLARTKTPPALLVFSYLINIKFPACCVV